MKIQRRDFIKYAGGLGLSGFIPSISFANAATETRFIFIIQRGAADGLDIINPRFDKNYFSLRGDMALKDDEVTILDNGFALHNSLTNIGQLYKDKQATFIHAIATPYRERSHFDAQNILELGSGRAYEFNAGWMNRLMGLLPQNKSTEAIAISETIPAALRGNNKVSSYYPSNIKAPSDDLMVRVASLYENDPLLYNLWLQAQQTSKLATGDEMENAKEIGKITAKLLNAPNGPRIAMLETTGWDTHTAQTTRLKNNLKQLDALVGQIKDGLGDNWSNTVVVIATEFGRTAAANGTQGTDHGTASCAMVLGGKVKGGKIIADWAGLSQTNLYQNRDVMPTAQMYGLLSGVLGETYGIEPEKVAANLFAAAKPDKIIKGIMI